LNLVFNPEFLTERSAKFDFINQARVVLGGDTRNTAVVAEMYKKRFGHTQCVIETTFETAELIKYMSNCYFAMKVSFLNEMKLISDAIGADWEDAKEGFVRDGRIGHSHMNVPGPDGRLGFGGSCFPKDIQAMIAFASTLGIESNTLKGAWATNLLVRPEQDWKELKGRAVI
jgi:UDPglucose 6-dehydrogenase